MQTTPTLAFVVATGARGEIGLNGTMPWHMPADLKHFKAVTMGHTMLMGRRTFASIGKALPGRTSFVVTRDSAFIAPGCRVFASLDEAVAAAPAGEELMVTGGATVYKALLARAERIYLTRIEAEFEADTWFPALADGDWREVAREEYAADERNAHAYSFITLERCSGVSE